MTRGRPRMPIGSRGETSYSQNDSGLWVASCSVRRTNGIRVRISRSAKSKAAAHRALENAVEEALRQAAGTNSKINEATLVKDLMWFWFEEHTTQQDLAHGTKRQYKDYIERLVIARFGELRVSELSVDMLDDHLKNLYKQGKSVASSAKLVLKPALALALRHFAISFNPLDRVWKLPSSPKKPVRALSDDELVLVLTELPNYRRGPGVFGKKPTNRLEDGVNAFLGSGLRIGELLGLRRKDVDLLSNPQTVTVKGTLIRGEEGLERQNKPKTPSSVRTVPITAFAARALQRQMAEAIIDSPDAPVFQNRDGGFVADCNFRRVFREFLESIGLDGQGITPHKLRATYATLVEKELGIQAASKSLGHSSINTTLSSYIAQPNIIDDKAASAMDRIFQGLTKKLNSEPINPDDFYEI